MYSVNNKTSSVFWDTDVSSPFLQSIKEVIPYCWIGTNTCYIPSNKIKPLTKSESCMEYDTAVKLAQCISKQILYMEKRGITLTGFELEDILMIDDGRAFIVANYERVVSYSSLVIRFFVPFHKPTFSALSGNHLPMTVSYLNARVGLGLLLVHLLGNDAANIRYSKLYWFINRCLKTPGVGFTIL